MFGVWGLGDDPKVYKRIMVAAAVVVAVVAVMAIIGATHQSAVAQAQTVVSEATFEWPQMEGAIHLGNGVYKYLLKPLDFGQQHVGPEDFAKDLATFKGTHPGIRVTAITAVNVTLIIVCECAQR